MCDAVSSSLYVWEDGSGAICNSHSKDLYTCDDVVWAFVSATSCAVCIPPELACPELRQFAFDAVRVGEIRTRFEMRGVCLNLLRMPRTQAR